MQRVKNAEIGLKYTMGNFLIKSGQSEYGLSQAHRYLFGLHCTAVCVESFAEVKLGSNKPFKTIELPM